MNHLRVLICHKDGKFTDYPMVIKCNATSGHKYLLLTWGWWFCILKFWWTKECPIKQHPFVSLAPPYHCLYEILMCYANDNLKVFGSIHTIDDIEFKAVNMRWGLRWPSKLLVRFSQNYCTTKKKSKLKINGKKG